MQHMKDIRIGNDILVTWSLFRGEEAYDLTDLPLTLYLSNAYGKKKVEHFFVEGNKVQWTFFGKDQKNTGKYSLILVVNEGGLGMQSTDVCNFVQLVSCSCQMSGADDAGVQTETIQLASTVDFPPIVIDSMLSEHSANPVQNAVVTKAINELKKQISESPELPELVGSDWNADEGEPGFIKNKPFGLTGGEWQELHGGPDDMPVEIISYNWDDSLWIEGLGQNPYIVVSDGTNSVIIKLNNESTVSKPFGLYTLELAGGILQLTGDTSEAFRIRYYVTDTIVPLDEAYIPDTIARKSDLGQGGVDYDDTELRTEIKGIKTDLKNKQDQLISGKTIKTINGESILGEGDLEIKGGGGTSSGKYQSNIKDGSIAMTEEYGDFKVGTKVSDLNGKTYDELFDGILFPTVNPTFTAPSASIAWSGYASTQEVGATGPTANNFTTSYNAGAITLSGKKQNNRGGTQDTANSFIYVNGNAANKTLPSTVTLGNTTFKYRAAYAQGPQPKNNKGNNYDSPLAAGSVDSGAITLNGTYPWYASTQTAGVLTKQALIAWNATAGAMQAGATGVGFEVQPHTASAPQKFKLPRKATSLQMYNTVAKAFETVALSDWDETTSQDTINGNTSTYYTYTYKGDARGSVKLIVKF